MTATANEPYSKYRLQRRWILMRSRIRPRLRAAGGCFEGPAKVYLQNLYRHNPVSSGVRWQFCIQAIDQRRTVLVQEVHEADRAFLRFAAWEGLRPCVLKLAAQCFILALGGLDDLAMQLLQVVLHSRQRGPRRAFQRRIDLH